VERNLCGEERLVPPCGPASQPDGEKGDSPSRIERSLTEGPSKTADSDKTVRNKIRTAEGRLETGSSAWEKEGNVRVKRQDPSSKANDPCPKLRTDADLGSKGSGFPFPKGVKAAGPGGRSPAGDASRAEKSHPKSRDGDIPAGSVAGPERQANRSLQAGRDVGELAANETRRVELGAQCQSTGERERGEFPLPSFCIAGCEDGGVRGGSDDPAPM